MGQELLEPPNVAGWVLGQSWFSTGAMLARMNFASTLAANQKFNLATASAARGAARRRWSTICCRGCTVDVGNDVYNDLLAYAAAGASWTGSDSQLQTKSPGIVHLVLGSAEYQFV